MWTHKWPLKKANKTGVAILEAKKGLFSVMFIASFFVVLVCTCLISMVAWFTWQAREMEILEARKSAFNLSQALAQHAYDSLKESDTILVGLMERLENADEENAAEEQRIRNLLINHVQELPQMHGIFIFRPDGSWRANSQGKEDSKLRNDDRAYFKYHRDHPEDHGPHIGEAIRSKSTNEWIVTLSRRINKRDGTFGGVALATIKMGYFNAFYERFAIGDHGAIILALDKGVLLVRRPFTENMLGKDMAGFTLFKDYLSISKEGIATIKSGLDGVTRINGYRHVQEYPLIVSAALSEEEVLKPWRETAIRNMVGTIIIVIIVGALGMRIIGQIKLRDESERELRRTRTTLEKLNAQLEGLAMTDSLTGLDNRRKLDDALHEEFGRARRQKTGLALIMMDVDRFKQYNDIYGHQEGDECLKCVGRVVAAGARRPGDIAARYGGEELTLFLPGASLTDALAVAERVRASIAALKVPHKGSDTGYVTISAGVAAIDLVTEDDGPVQIIKAADGALYKAKHTGRNKVSYLENLEELVVIAKEKEARNALAQAQSPSDQKPI